MRLSLPQKNRLIAPVARDSHESAKIKTEQGFPLLRFFDDC